MSVVPAPSEEGSYVFCCLLNIRTFAFVPEADMNNRVCTECCLWCSFARKRIFSSGC